MRTLLVGLVLIALGIAGSEYVRRNPPPEKAKEEARKETPLTDEAPGITPVTAKDLIATDEAKAAESESVAALTALLSSAPATEGKVTTVFKAPMKARELRAADGFGVMVVEHEKKFALVKVSKAAPPQVLALRKEPISALAIDGDTVFWAEGGFVLSVPADGAAPAKTVISFSKATVAAVSAFKGSLVVALVVRGADVFSTDPNAAIARVLDGRVTVLAADQVRPHDLINDATEAFWISGYPAWLNRAALDGSFSAKLAERADGPLAFDGEFIVHRYPQTSGPEIRRMAHAGGNLQTLARGDVDWLAASGGLIAYTTTGIGPRLYEVKAGSDPVEKNAFKGTANGVARSAEGTWLLFNADDGTTFVQLIP